MPASSLGRQKSYSNRPPDRGLSPLEAEDAGIFFGRDAPIVEALDRLRGLLDATPPRPSPTIPHGCGTPRPARSQGCKTALENNSAFVTLRRVRTSTNSYLPGRDLGETASLGES